MPRERELCKILCIILIIATFVSFNLAKAEQTTQPKKVQQAEYPPPLNAPSWAHETGIGHIFLPNPENDNSNFPLDVNVTVLNDNSFVQGSISFIEINITIPDTLVSYIDLQAIAFNAQITNALQATPTQASTQAFFMFLMPENFYFPNAPVSNISDLIIIPYDWAGSNYIVLQDAGSINLTLSCGLAVPKNVTVTPDWQQRSQFTTSLIIPLITTNPIQAPTPTPEKEIFHQPIPFADPNNVLYISFLGFGAIIDLILAVCLDYYRKTKKPRIYKMLLGVPVAFLSLVFLPDLLLFRPYDLNIIQVIVTCIICIVGTLLVIKWRKELPLFFFRRKKMQKQQSREQPTQKTESSNNTSKEQKQPRNNGKAQHTENR